MAAAATLGGCAIRDVYLDEDALGAGGSSGASGTHASGAAGKSSSEVGGAAPTVGGANNGGGGTGGVAGAPLLTAIANAGTANAGTANSGTSNAGTASTGTGGAGLPDPAAGAAGLTGKKLRGVTVVATAVTGTVFKSINYSLVLTVGESPSGNAEMGSPNYHLYRGFVGASQ